MMETDILIIGQGICGTFLAWWLEQSGLSYIVIDEPRPFTASRAAAGLINPVTGRRMVKTWMIDELLPFAEEAYRRIGEGLGISCMEPTHLVDFFPTAQMRLAFLQRFGEDPQYLQLPQEEHGWDPFFRYDLGYGMVSPCCLVNMAGLLEASRKKMKERGSLLQERFEQAALILDTNDHAVTEGARAEVWMNGIPEIRYKEIRARKIIFCDGIESCGSPYFSRLPFAPNKGEALIVEIAGLRQSAGSGANAGGETTGAGGGSAGAVFKKGISLIPWKEDLYWAGSSYEWSFQHDAPTEAFRKRMESILDDWLKPPFKIVDHFASVRPATLERRPFVGFHPLYPSVGILNGMGTKGCSLAPYFAHQLVQHITKGIPILPLVDVQRFRGVLSKGN